MRDGRKTAVIALIINHEEIKTVVGGEDRRYDNMERKIRRRGTLLSCSPLWCLRGGKTALILLFSSCLFLARIRLVSVSGSSSFLSPSSATASHGSLAELAYPIFPRVSRNYRSSSRSLTLAAYNDREKRGMEGNRRREISNYRDFPFWNSIPDVIVLASRAADRTLILRRCEPDRFARDT